VSIEIPQHRQEIDDRDRALRTLAEIGSAVLEAFDSGAVVDLVLDKAMVVGHFDLGILHMVRGDRLEAVAARGLNDPSHAQSYSRSAEAGGREAMFNVIARREPLVVEDVQSFDGLRVFKAEDARSAIVVPIQARAEVLGVIALGSRESRRFPPPTVELLAAIGSQLGLAIQKARLYEEMQVAFAELRRTEEQHARLAAILEATPDLVAIADAAGRRLYLNPAGRRLLGITASDDISSGRLDDDRPDWARQQFLREILPAVTRNGVWYGESAYRDREGTEIPVSKVVLAHRAEDGTLAYYSTIARDISGRKRMERELEERARELAEANVLLAERASTDTLTGLSNRDHGVELLQKLIALARRQGMPLAFAFLDIDHFKDVNDRYGHPVGDEVLRQLGLLLNASFRGEDVVARWGGEEFLVAMFGTGKAQAVKRLTAVLSDFRDFPFASSDERLFHVTCSAGVAEFPRDGTDPKALHLVADEALYAAKTAGRDRVVAAPDARC